MNLTDSRFELKYHLTFKQYLDVKASLLPFARKDTYSNRAPDGRYFVRSLYYDTSDYVCFRDKIEGEERRVKLRMRCYHPEKGKNEFVSVEIKKRFGERMQKKVTRIPMDEYYFYLKNNRWKLQCPILEEFLRMKLKWNFHPLLLVDYFREGFETRIGKKIRLTFDRGLRSFPDTRLFSARPGRDFYRDERIVFEIKTKGFIPAWLMGLIRKNSLERVSNSKYVNSVLTSNPIWKKKFVFRD